MGPRVIRVGTRGSALARVQTDAVVNALQAAHPRLRIEVVPITTSGDRTQHINAPGAGWGSGVFVKELEEALLANRIDLAVHSLKDVPPRLTDGLALIAIPSRADPRDALVTLDGRAVEDLASGARIGTSSARRAAFLQAVRSDLRVVPIRGNVETRLRKLSQGQYDGIVLACAGLERLQLEAPHVVLEPTLLPPAPGQGALALEARADDRELSELASALDDLPTRTAVRAERRLMARLEGGCRFPVGALGTPWPADQLELLGGLQRQDGQVVLERRLGRMDAPDELADQLAELLQSVPIGSTT
jgi:hydroxymethylbilane synthase